jgi:tetrahydrofolate synthase/dihydrofolate synthase
VTEAAAAAGLSQVRITARFEEITTQPCTTLLDVGHNPQAAGVLAENLHASRKPGEKTLAVFGMLEDKDRAQVVRLTAPEIDRWFIAGLPGPRGGSAEALKMKMLEAGVEERAIESFPAIADALYAARLSAEDEPAAPVRIIIFGSFVTVGEALEVFAKEGLRR